MKMKMAWIMQTSKLKKNGFIHNYTFETNIYLRTQWQLCRLHYYNLYIWTVWLLVLPLKLISPNFLIKVWQCPLQYVTGPVDTGHVDTNHTPSLNKSLHSTKNTLMVTYVLDTPSLSNIDMYTFWLLSPYATIAFVTLYRVMIISPNFQISFEKCFQLYYFIMF